MLGLPGASLIAGGASAVSNVLGSWMQNRQNRRLASDAQDFEIEMWNKSNQYNSPEAQMSRLKSAGLNPNLVYGTGSVAGNTAQASQPKAHVPEYKAPIPDSQIAFNVLNTALSTMKTQADTMKTVADTALVKQETGFHSELFPYQKSILFSDSNLKWADMLHRINSTIPYEDQKQKNELEMFKHQFEQQRQKSEIGKYDEKLAKDLYEFKSNNPYLNMILNILKAGGISK